MDIQMPEMNGRDATARSESWIIKDAKTIPIFAPRADAFVEDQWLSIASGMNGHFQNRSISRRFGRKSDGR